MKKNVILAMFTVGRQLTGIRPAKDDTPYVVVSCTNGKIILAPSAADIIGVKEGSYVTIVGEEGGSGFAIAKTEKGQGGSKLGGNLDFAAANAYKMMGGNSDENRSYTISADSKETADGVDYFILEFAKAAPKTIKNKKA